MHGADHLIAMRRQGSAPSMVRIDTDPGVLRNDRLWPFDPDQPQLHIGPDENLRRLDLRCLVDLPVQIGGCDAERVKAVTEACIAAKASRVIACTHRRQGHPDYPTFPIVSVTDTEGAMEWQES